MAPRRTVKVKQGERREDAAYDLLVPMGFTKKAIKQKIKELLKVYGGPDGWLFIEEGSYKLLIDELLGDLAETTVQDEDTAEGEDVDSASAAVVGEAVVAEASHASAGDDAAAARPRKRRPYYGWVGSTEEDVLVLSPAMLPAQLNAMFGNRSAGCSFAGTA